MNIRYNESLNKEINRIVRNFNNKVKRLEKSEKDLILPSIVSIKDLKKDVSTRRELLRELEKLKSYSKRGIEETITTLGGNKISRYELENIKKEARRIKYQLTREITKKKTTKPRVFGKIQDVTFAEMGDSSYLNLVARREALNKNIEKLDSKLYNAFKTLLEKTKSKKSYDFNNLQYNWANEMLMPLAYLTEFPMDKLEEVRMKIGSLKEQQFLDLFNNEAIMRTITELYLEAIKGNIRNKEKVHTLLTELSNNIDEILKDYA